MPHIFRAGALVLGSLLGSLASVSLVPSVAQASEFATDTTASANVESTHVQPTTVAISPYLGLGVGEKKSWMTLGIDAVASYKFLRVGALGETSGGVFGSELYTLGAVVGVGTSELDDHLEANLGVEGGAHFYRRLGDHLFSSNVSGGSADLPFAGIRASLTYRFGKSRVFGLGVLGFVRTDLGHAAADATVDSWGDGKSTEKITAGESSYGAALKLSLAF